MSCCKISHSLPPLLIPEVRKASKNNHFHYIPHTAAILHLSSVYLTNESSSWFHNLLSHGLTAQWADSLINVGLFLSPSHFYFLWSGLWYSRQKLNAEGHVPQFSQRIKVDLSVEMIHISSHFTPASSFVLVLTYLCLHPNELIFLQKHT